LNTVNCSQPKFRKLKVEDFIKEGEYEKIFSQQNNENSYPFLVISADDENIIRQSIGRIFSHVSKELNIDILFLEAEDGIELLYIVYKLILKGIKIDLIFSDDYMKFMKGSKASFIFEEIFANNIQAIPFYLVSAYEKDLIHRSKIVTDIISKPLLKDTAMEIVKKYLV
jgi:hypothetical protein